MVHSTEIPGRMKLDYPIRLLPRIKVSATIANDLQKDTRELQAANSISKKPALPRAINGILDSHILVFSGIWGCSLNLILLSDYTFHFSRLSRDCQWRNVYQTFSGGIGNAACPGSRGFMVPATY